MRTCRILKMSRLAALVAALPLMSGCSGDISIATVNPPVGGGTGESGDFVQDVSAPHIFTGKTNAYHTFRIPAIVKTTKGTLVAFCEGRKNSGSDTGDINMICRRSIDGGKTWSKIITIWDDGTNTCGNPSPVVDPETGRIHLLMTWNYETDGKSAGDFNKVGATKDTRRVFYTWSDDDGVTWEKPVEITSTTKKSDWGWYATGPCHAIILNRGAHKGRIVVPCDHNVIGGSGYSHVIYSDDKGKTWKIGGEVRGGNESTIEELEDGRLLISCRQSGCRLLAYSSDGGETFTAGVSCTELVDPRCEGSLTSTVKNGKQVLLHCNCASTDRTHLTVKASLDGGNKWSAGYTVWAGYAAYSDMVMLDDNTVGVFYENGDTGSYARISFEAVSVTNCL